MTHGITEIDGKFYQPASVVMLSTQKAEGALIFKCHSPEGTAWLKKDSCYYLEKVDGQVCHLRDSYNSKLGMGYDAFLKACTPQHLYILSDEEIKDNTWCIDQVGNLVYVTISKRSDIGNFRKIIATTDRELEVEVGDEGWKSSDGGWNEYKPVYKALPRPSNNFLEAYVREYNKGNTIEKVLVEMNSLHYHPKMALYNEYTLKIAPDNTITIKPKAEKVYTKQEMYELLRMAYALGRDEKSKSQAEGRYIDTCTEWIEKNL